MTRRVAKALAASALGASVGYVVANLSFWMICVLAGHSYIEEIYAAWNIGVFAVFWGGMAMVLALHPP
jgi:hypothetical protein